MKTPPGTATNVTPAPQPAPNPAGGNPPAGPTAAPPAPPTSVSVFVDGVEVSVAPGSTVIKATDKAGHYVPHFCYHPGLTVVGQCRMCFVEIEGAPKLATACSTPVAPGMKILTKSDKVKAGQNATLEFTLLNHPLDCPICDRGGECKLQDYTYSYGPPLSRMHDEKIEKDKHRPISDKVMLDQERCILCTRCSRFSAEVDGRAELVVTNRGSSDVIDVFDNRAVTSGFQGNVVDLCPVGALTATDYRFQARPWELRKHEAICTGCAVGCNVEIHTKHRHPGIVRPDKSAPNPHILRLVPRENLAVNTWWMCDKGRWGYHFNNEDDRRLVDPMAKRDRNSQLAAMSLREIQMLLEERNKDGASWEFWVSENVSHEGISWAKELAESWKARGRKMDGINPHPLAKEFIAWYATRVSNPWFAGQANWHDVKKVVSSHTYRELETIAPVLALKLGQLVRKGTLKWEVVGVDTLATNMAAEAGTVYLIDPPTSSAEIAKLGKTPTDAAILILWRNVNSRGLVNEGICPIEVLATAMVEYKSKSSVFFFGQTTQNESAVSLANFFAKASYLVVTDSFRSVISDKADVVLPLTPLYEAGSTFTSIENHRQFSKGVHLDSPNTPSIHRGGPLVNPALRLL